MKKLFLSVAAAILAFPVLADEGMWLLPLLKQQKFAEMQALGLRLSDQEVYSAEAPSLKDAVVRFGGGCTFLQFFLMLRRKCGKRLRQVISSSFRTLQRGLH